VGIDGRFLHVRRGIGNIVHNLVEALARLPAPPELHIYVQGLSGLDVPPAKGPVQFRAVPHAPYLLWEQLLVPRAAARDGVDLLHSPANTGPLWIPAGMTQVVTVHDVMFSLPPTRVGRSPSAYQRLGRRYRRAVVPRVARRAAAVITDSEHSLADVGQVLGVAAERIHLVRPAAGGEFRVLEAEEVRRSLPPAVPAEARYALVLGAVDPRKNTALVLEAFARFRDSGSHDHRLVLAGLDRLAEAALRRRASELGIASQVTPLGFVTPAELVALYNGASMFLYPSRYEGFGLPVLEAMACGTPVVASCTTSIPEVAGSAAILVEPTDLDALVRAMRLVAEHEPTRRRLREAGLRRAAAFSWDRAARETLAVYETALST
jgi:glycosyltransferase involved in cell wall biosynthesis